MKKTSIFALVFLGVSFAEYSAVIPQFSKDSNTPKYLIGGSDPDSPVLPPVVDYNPPLTQIEKIVPSDGRSYDSFGNSLNIDGNNLLVSSRCKTYVQEFNGTNWQTATILTTNDATGSCEGYTNSSDIDGDWIVIGNHSRKSAYVFKKDSGVWTQHSKLTGTDSAFSWSVAIDDGKILISSGDDYEGYYWSNQKVYAYEFDGTDWNLEQTITSSLANRGFGNHIRMSGNRAIIGAPEQAGSSVSGQAVILDHDGSEWKETAVLAPSDGLGGDSFGDYVSIDGDAVIVGAPSQYDDHGSAYIYEFDGSNWNENILDSEDSAPDEWFGDSVSIDGNLAIVGAPFMTAGSVRSGNAYIFEKDGSNWVKAGEIRPGDQYDRDTFGTGVLIYKGNAFVGATREDQAGNGVGSVYVFGE